MTAQQAGSPDPWLGCVVAIEPGVARVLTDGGEVRASYGGGMLAHLARDRSLLPEPGDWVVLRRWPDRRVTLEAPLHGHAACAPVLSLSDARRRARR